MANVVKREQRAVVPTDVFDRMFENWAQMLPVMPWGRPGFFRRELVDDMIRVDEFRDGDSYVIRADLPGIDPDKDVELTASDGMLHIQAERHEEENRDEKGYRRHEIHYGTFSRSLQLPPGVKESDISASYKSGILEIRIPTSKESTTRVPISKK